MTDPHHLDRFLTAQQDSYADALDEVRSGRKQSHWMWFVFPQLAGLGRSPTAQHYAIRSLDEAQAYLDHPVLGARLREMVAALQALPPTSAERVFGPVDAMKLHSSLTLFAQAGGGALFAAALDRWFDGTPDAATIRLLGQA
jgi:uncharacterized protein (DUF1810 family)